VAGTEQEDDAAGAVDENGSPMMSPGPEVVDMVELWPQEEAAGKRHSRGRHSGGARSEDEDAEGSIVLAGLDREVGRWHPHVCCPRVGLGI